MISVELEAQILAGYLAKSRPTKSQITLYTKGSSSFSKATQEKTLAMALAHPYLLPYLDAYDAFFRPNSQLRQRLYLMFSILEASPELVNMFLPQKRSPWYVCIVVGIGIRGIYRLLLGVLLVKAKGL